MPPDSPSFQPSENLPRFDQESFDHYVSETRTWIADNRAFISENRDLEIELNMPFEIRPDQPAKRGILLVHGLGQARGILSISPPRWRMTAGWFAPSCCRVTARAPPI